MKRYSFDDESGMLYEESVPLSAEELELQALLRQRAIERKAELYKMISMSDDEDEIDKYLDEINRLNGESNNK